MPQSTLFNWMEQVWNTEVSSIVMQFFKKMSLDDLLWNKILRGWFNCLLHLKFIYSKKAKKICKIFTLLLSYVVPVKSKVKISRNFVAFSEYMNFKFQILTVSFGNLTYFSITGLYSFMKIFLPTYGPTKWCHR